MGTGMSQLLIGERDGQTDHNIAILLGSGKRVKNRSSLHFQIVFMPAGLGFGWLLQVPGNQNKNRFGDIPKFPKCEAIFSFSIKGGLG